MSYHISHHPDFCRHPFTIVQNVTLRFGKRYNHRNHSFHSPITGRRIYAEIRLRLRKYIYTLLMVTLMIVAATQNARKKGKAIQGITWKIAVTLIVVEVLTQSILLGFRIVPPTAQYIISISGMMIGNSMVLSILFLNRFTAEVETHREETELILSLGGTPKQAIRRQLLDPSRQA